MRNKIYSINNHKRNNKNKLNLVIIKKVINTCQQKIITRIHKQIDHVPRFHLLNILITYFILCIYKIIDWVYNNYWW